MTLDQQGIVVQCSGCGRRNRLRYETLDRRQRCGGCGGEIPRIAGPLELVDASAFDVLVGRSAVPVLVDFWAPWCGPCRMMAPELKQLAAIRAGQLLVLKVNTEEHPELAGAHRIGSLPTLSLHWQGRERDRIMGARPAPALQRWLDSQLAAVRSR
jgi:thioredoxin 2